MITELSGKLVLLDVPQVAREHFELLPGLLLGVNGSAQKQIHLLSPLSELVSEVHAPEGDSPHLPLDAVASRGMNFRLRGEGHDGDGVVPEFFPVLGRLVGVRGEHQIEQPCGPDEICVVGRVLLVPEHGGDSGSAAPDHEIPKFWAVGALLAD